MPRLLLLNHVLLLLCCSIYLGTGVSLVFFQLPIEPQLTVDNYYMIFVAPERAATRFFTYMTIVMLICALIMLATEWLSGLRWPPLVVLVAVILATLLTIYVLFPLNNELASHIADAGRLKSVLHEWANLNRLRFAFWFVEWAAMAYWFYQLALKARTDR